MSVTITLERLTEILEMAKNNAEYHDGKSLLIVEIKTLPSGSPELTIHQPSTYPDCSGTTFLVR